MKLKTLLSSITAICFSLFLAFAFVPAAPAFAGNFSQTCSDATISGSTLSANCQRRNGSYRDTSIDLDSQIGNINGTLENGDHNFSQTCRGIQLINGSIMDGECKTRDQRWVSTSLNLDGFVDNTDGVLKFD